MHGLYTLAVLTLRSRVGKGRGKRATPLRPRPPSHRDPDLRGVRLEKGVVVSVAGAARGLEAVDVVGPPGARSPPQRALPHIAVLLEVVQKARDSALALRVGAAGELAEDADLAVLAQPVGRARDALGADGRRHTNI